MIPLMGSAYHKSDVKNKEKQRGEKKKEGDQKKWPAPYGVSL